MSEILVLHHGSHKDRHTNIGKGTIGVDTLRKIVHDERFLAVVKIPETPYLCVEGEDKKTKHQEEIS